VAAAPEVRTTDMAIVTVVLAVVVEELSITEFR
jgi:hypothetical protein